MKKLLFITVAALVILAGCATPVQEEPRQVRLPQEAAEDYGVITSSTVELHSPAVQEAAQQEPVSEPAETQEAAAAVPAAEDQSNDKPVKASPETAEAEQEPSSGVVAQSEKPREDEVQKDQQPEEPAGAAADDPQEPAEETQPKASAAAEPTAPADSEDTAVVQPQRPAEPAHETAAKEVEDKDSGSFRAAWFGLPILLLLLVILVVELIRWTVYRKPLFGWNTGRTQEPAGTSDRSDATTEPMKRTKKGIAKRFEGFVDKLYADLESDDEDDDLI